MGSSPAASRDQLRRMEEKSAPKSRLTATIGNSKIPSSNVTVSKRPSNVLPAKTTPMGVVNPRYVSKGTNASTKVDKLPALKDRKIPVSKSDTTKSSRPPSRLKPPTNFSSRTANTGDSTLKASGAIPKVISKSRTLPNLSTANSSSVTRKSGGAIPKTTPRFVSTFPPARQLPQVPSYEPTPFTEVYSRPSSGVKRQPSANYATQKKNNPKAADNAVVSNERRSHGVNNPTNSKSSHRLGQRTDAKQNDSRTLTQSVERSGTNGQTSQNPNGTDVAGVNDIGDESNVESVELIGRELEDSHNSSPNHSNSISQQESIYNPASHFRSINENGRYVDLDDNELSLVENSILVDSDNAHRFPDNIPNVCDTDNHAHDNMDISPEQSNSDSLGGATGTVNRIEIVDSDSTSASSSSSETDVSNRLTTFLRNHDVNPETRPLPSMIPVTFIDLTNDSFVLESESETETASVASDLSDLTSDVPNTNHSPQNDIFTSPSPLPPIRSAGIIGVSFEPRRQRIPSPRDRSVPTTLNQSSLLLDLGPLMTPRTTALTGPRPNSVVRTYVSPQSDHTSDWSLPRPPSRSPTRIVARPEAELMNLTMSSGITSMTSSAATAASAIGTTSTTGATATVTSPRSATMASDELLARQLSDEMNREDMYRHRRFLAAMTSRMASGPRLSQLHANEGSSPSSVSPTEATSPTTSSTPAGPVPSRPVPSRPLPTGLSLSGLIGPVRIGGEIRSTATGTETDETPPPSDVPASRATVRDGQRTNNLQRISTLVNMGNDLVNTIVNYREMTDDIVDNQVLITLMLLRRIDMLRFSLLTDHDDYEALWDLSERMGEVRSRGLTDEDINKLPCHTFDAETDPPEDCHICLSAYVTEEKLRYLDCTHEFHAACIDQWLRRNATCPICRKNFKT